MSARIDSLRAELRHDSAFVATATPRLSWTVASDEPGWLQTAVEVRSGDEIVKLDTADSVLVDWPFAPLAAGEARELSVRAIAGERQTDWSTPLLVEAGFLADGVWIARPIGLAEPSRDAQPVLLRRSFTAAGPVRRARLYFTALGVAELELNGVVIDAGVLAPGWTSYRNRLIHETVDVTALLTVGDNVLGATLAGAWYTEKYGFFAFAERIYGDQPSLLAQLEIEYEDGSTETIATGDGWRAFGDGPVVDSGIYAGEHHDARLAIDGWSTVGFDDAGWSAVSIHDVATPVPEARVAAPVRRIEEIAVKAVLPSESGVLLDFGQNLVGRLRITVRGPAGTRIELRHAEVLEHGDLSLRPLRNAAATDSLTLAGGGITWEPQFTFHGFRYARLDGWPGEFDPTAVTAVVLHTDMVRTGWFESSHPMLDQLHANVVWGMRGNFLSIPTDCPQRDERLGWTGDLQVFSPTASFLYDCEGFLTSWLRDLALEQSLNGGEVPLVVPSVLSGMGPGTVAAWGDAATVVPWVMHERFGDVGVVANQYSSMTSWVEVLLRQSAGTGLWAGTFQLGDWLDPSAPPDKPANAKVDSDIVASAYFARSLQIVADAAGLLDRVDDAARYSAEAEKARRAFRAEYVTAAGRMMSDAQTAYALALQFDLVTEPALRQHLADRLAVLVRRDGYRIGTGFVGTPLVADALSDGGHLFAASRLLTQTENPSWLYPITQGATTIWERWDSILEDGSVNPGEMTSFNHYALGAVADWMHRTVAGLAPDQPGYRRLRIAPRPLPTLDYARAKHRTPYGTATVAWRRAGELVEVEAEVPANTTAVVSLPGRDEFVVGSGNHSWTFEDSITPSPERLDLDSSTAEIIDDPRAYRAVLDTIAAHDPAAADTFRRETAWLDGRTVRQSLMFVPPELPAAIETALATLYEKEN